MPVSLSVRDFRAEQPRVDARLLPNNYAQRCYGMDTSAGRLDVVRMPASIYSAGRPIRSLYHYSFQGDTYWMTWPGVVDVVRSPVAKDQLGRIYFTGDGEPRMTTFAAGVQGSAGPYPAQSFVLGVVAPRTAPTIAGPAGGTTETRAYVYTLVTALQEESAPSPPATASGNASGTWNLSDLDGAPPNTGAIVSTAIAAGVATIEVPTTYGMTAGDELTLAGTGVSALNGRQRILAVTDATHFTVATDAGGSGTGGTWARVAAHNVSGMRKRIYRQVGTGTTFLLVGEVDAAATTFADSVLATNLITPLPNLEPDLPPKDMHSLARMENGSLVGLSGNELCFSEQGRPHSWPTSYRYSLPADGVALAVVGNGVIVLHESGVSFATAPTPAAASITRIGAAQCVSKRGVAPVDGGCLFPARDGLYLATSSSVQLVSGGLFRQAEWEALSPASMEGVFYDRRYFASYLNPDAVMEMLVIDASATGSVERIDWSPTALHVSPVDNRLYVAQEQSVMLWGGTVTAGYMIGRWVSKVFALPEPANLAVAQVFADFANPFFVRSAADLAFNEALLAAPENVNGALCGQGFASLAINASRLRYVPSADDARVGFTLLDQDGNTLYSCVLRDSKPFRLPAGFKRDAYAFSLFTNVPVIGFAAATSMANLKAIV